MDPDGPLFGINKWFIFKNECYKIKNYERK